MVSKKPNKRMPCLALCGLLLFGSASAADLPPSCAGYGDELAVMAGADAALRTRQDFLAPPEDPLQARRAAQLALIERSNGESLQALLAQCGWPLRGVHGMQAGAHAWQLVQRGGQDLALQKTAARQLEQAVAAGEVPGRELAKLEDRIAVAEGRPQRYGTRMRQVDACRWGFHPMDDPAQVAARRAQLGLPTLEEQERVANSIVIHENCENRTPSPPPLQT